MDKLITVVELDPAPIAQINSALQTLESVYRMEL
jgi:hypothetical protein